VRFSRPFSSSRRVVVVILVTLLSAGLLADAASADTKGDLAAAEQRVTDALAEADAAVAQLNEAESKLATTEEEIGTAQQKLERMQAEQAELAKVARLRALTAYKGGSFDLDDIFGINTDVMDQARRNTLLDSVNARGNEAIARLTQLTDELHVRDKDLNKRREQEADERDDLQEKRAKTQRTVDKAEATVQQLKKKLEEEKRVAEFQAALARAAAKARARARQNTGGGGSFGGNAGTIIVSGDWVCPVQGGVSFRNDWGEPRSGGRRHKGTDMFAAIGTPVVAVVGGSVFYQDEGTGGKSAYVNGSDGNTYYYTHLNDYVGGGRNVSGGELIGHVGNTGNAAGGASHLHFEIRPGGPNGAQINPYPTLAAHC
jgi:murein DD-endopeptidase MepM/ murein hydrolase activator NlpD